MERPNERPSCKMYVPTRNEATETINCMNLILFFPRNAIWCGLVWCTCLVDLASVQSETIVSSR